MHLFSTAKINLSLCFVQRRPDGFYSVATVRSPVGWCDAAEAFPAGGLPAAVADEASLLAQLRCEATRRSAFGVLVQRYGERLYWHVRKLVLQHDDADDVLQNTFIKAWENVGKFRGEAQLFTWLFRIATNEAITFLNHTRRLQHLSLGDARQLLSNLCATDAHFRATDAQQMLQAAILTLPERQRIVFNLRYFDEMPYEQMSEMLGVSVGALKASYHIAEKKIKKNLGAL